MELSLHLGSSKWPWAEEGGKGMRRSRGEEKLERELWCWEASQQSFFMFLLTIQEDIQDKVYRKMRTFHSLSSEVERRPHTFTSFPNFWKVLLAIWLSFLLMESQTTSAASFKKEPLHPARTHLCNFSHGVGSQEMVEYFTYLPLCHCIPRGEVRVPRFPGYSTESRN